MRQKDANAPLTIGGLLDDCIATAIGVAAVCSAYLVGLGFPSLATSALPALAAWLTRLGIGTTRGVSDRSFHMMAGALILVAMLGILMATRALLDAYFRRRRRTTLRIPTPRSW